MTGSPSGSPRRSSSVSVYFWIEHTPPRFEQGGADDWKGQGGAAWPVSRNACRAYSTRSPALSDSRERPNHSAMPNRAAVLLGNGIGTYVKRERLLMTSSVTLAWCVFFIITSTA